MATTGAPGFGQDRWRNGADYSDQPGFCRSSTLEEIRRQGHVLTLGRYTGSSYVEDDGTDSREGVEALAKTWRKQRSLGHEFDEAIGRNLERLRDG